MHIRETLNVAAEMIRVLTLEGQSLLTCAERYAQETEAAKLKVAVGYLQHSLNQGGKIVVTGLGKSGKIAQKIAATLCSTGSLAVYIHPTEGLHGDLGLVRSSDVVLALSNTGNTEELLQWVPTLKQRGVRMVGLGGNPQSRLAHVCDAWIDARVTVEACPHNLAPTASTTLALALGDALAVTLMQLRGFATESFAENHPGGALGRQLLLSVESLMHQGEAVPIVHREAPMDEVIVLATEKKLGGVLVVEGDALVGLITDGDLRRALSYRERFFELRAEQVMTQNPVVIQTGMKAREAFALMENRSSQISVLPVVDPQGHWKGLIRLHDLVRTL